jgi:asparagine synthase (glutamine-hydrolysing)
LVAAAVVCADVSNLAGGAKGGMSGICALWRRDDHRRTGEMLHAMAAGLVFCGTERLTCSVDGSAGVAVVARFGRQQIYSNERVQMACDAQLYNEQELASWANPAARGETRSATAALLAALYERLGVEFVEKLRGAFSFVLWDRREHKFLAAVDGFGIHRLVYCDTGKALLVATRLEALVRSGEVETRINPRAVANVLNFTANAAPATILTGVERLVPGALLTASQHDMAIRKYWDMRYGVATERDEKRLSRKLEALVEQSVAAHSKADSFADLGAFLSGGTDSSTVVGMMSRRGHGPVNTFSIGFEEQPFNELGYAQIVARQFHANHQTYLVGPKDCFEALPEMIRCFDEPYGNSSAIPTYFCARLAAQNGVKALLAGDGGDELFGGNERYLTDHIFQIYQRAPRLLRKGLIEPALRLIPIRNGVMGKARSYTNRSNMPPLERYFSYHFLVTHSPAQVFEPGFLEALRGYPILEVPSEHYRLAPACNHLDRLLYLDVKMTLGDNDLPKVTSMTELAGVEPHFPFLDREVVEFSGTLPAELKVRGFQKRYLFKLAFRNLLPIEVIEKKKHGFGIPVAEWLKTDRRLRELAHDTLLSSRARERGYFRRDFIEELFRKHEADTTTYYGDCLWPFFTMELWHRQFVDEPARMAV